MTTDRYTLEHETLPAIRRLIVDISSPESATSGICGATPVANETKSALFALLALVHELADRVEALEARS